MLNSLIEAGFIEMTITDKSHSSKQKYIISKERELLKSNVKSQLPPPEAEA